MGRNYYVDENASIKVGFGLWPTVSKKLAGKRIVGLKAYDQKEPRKQNFIIELETDLLLKIEVNGWATWQFTQKPKNKDIWDLI